MTRRRGAVAGELLLIAGLCGYAGVAALLERFWRHGAPLTLDGPLCLLMTLVPAALWLGYFYLQDRLEPEPMTYVLGLFVLGAMVAAPLARFLTDRVVDVRGWDAVGVLGVREIVAAVLVVGLAQELAQYVVVRYTIYRAAEFDEPMDGIVYMTACAIGFASADNLAYLRGLPAAHLGVVAVNLVIRTLAQACFGAVLGYALGSARFSAGTAASRTRRLSLGLLAAAVLNGLFHILQRVVTTSGLGASPWRGLWPSALLTLVVLVAATRLVERDLGLSPFRRTEAPGGAGVAGGGR